MRRIRWSWDHPQPGSAIDGRTIVADGWVAHAPVDAAVALLAGDRILAASPALCARPDVAAALGLDDDAVGFHLEASLPPATTDGSVGLALALIASGDGPRVLERRQVQLAAGELPYEAAFRHAEVRAEPLHRDEIYGSGPPVTEVFPPMLAITRRYVRGSVLDLGCGAGPYAAAHRAAGRAVYGLEWSARGASLARAGGLAVVRGDARRLPFPDACVDTVIAVEVLEHVPDAALAVRECARVARVNLVVSVPNAAVIPHLFRAGVVPWHLLEATHVNFFSARTLEQLLRKVFRHVVVGYYARAYPFPDTAPLYAHLFAVGAHDPAGVRPVRDEAARGAATAGARRPWLRRWMSGAKSVVSGSARG